MPNLRALVLALLVCLAASWAGALELYLPGLTPAGASSLANVTDAPEYRLTLDVSPDWRRVTGRQQLRAVNRSEDVWEEVVLRLLPNALGGRMTAYGLRVDGEPVQGTLEADGTALRAPLPRALLPGEAVALSLSFTLQVGEGGGADQGDPLAAEAALYQVRVAFPAHQDIVASGRVLARETVGERQTVTVAAGPVREFYLALTEGYQQQSLGAGETVIHSYAPPHLSAAAQRGLEIAAASLDLFGELFGPYPYRELSFVAVPVRAAGIEYPGVINLATSLYGDARFFETVIVHEVAHQWSYNVVGSDQVLEPWLDEALAQYLTYLYFARYGDAEAFLGYWERLWRAAPDPAQPVGEAVAAYEGGAYSGIVYGRGLFFFLELEAQLGQDVLLAALGAFYERHAWDFVGAAELKAVLAETCRCAVAPLFEDWVFP
jgi:hypothetical protein